MVLAHTSQSSFCDPVTKKSDYFEIEVLVKAHQQDAGADLGHLPC